MIRASTRGDVREALDTAAGEAGGYRWGYRVEGPEIGRIEFPDHAKDEHVDVSFVRPNPRGGAKQAPDRRDPTATTPIPTLGLSSRMPCRPPPLTTLTVVSHQASPLAGTTLRRNQHGDNDQVQPAPRGARKPTRAAAAFSSTWSPRRPSNACSPPPNPVNGWP